MQGSPESVETRDTSDGARRMLADFWPSTRSCRQRILLPTQLISPKSHGAVAARETPEPEFRF